MGQRRNLGKNQQITWEKEKWKHNVPKLMGYSESSAKMKFVSHIRKGLKSTI